MESKRLKEAMTKPIFYFILGFILASAGVGIATKVQRISYMPTEGDKQLEEMGIHVSTVNYETHQEITIKSCTCKDMEKKEKTEEWDLEFKPAREK